MDVWEYHRSLVGQAWSDVMTVMQWRNTPLPMFLFPVIIFVVTLIFFQVAASRSEARSQFLWWVISGVVTLAAVFALFFVFLVAAPYRVARIAHAAAATQAATAAAQLATARADADAQRQRLDDRRQQQGKADEYTTWINSGRDISVHWADAQLRGNQQGIIAQRDASRDWLREVRTRLDTDFGPQIAARFNFGRPADTPIGFSEPKEHEARVAELIRMTGEMREGHLPFQVR